MANGRPEGFYWVRYGGRWEVAAWEQRECLGWWLTASELDFDDVDMDEIGPLIEPPLAKSSGME